MADSHRSDAVCAGMNACLNSIPPLRASVAATEVLDMGAFRRAYLNRRLRWAQIPVRNWRY